MATLDFWHQAGPDCIPVVVLKNHEPEFSYILGNIFSMCLKETCFSNSWKVSPLVSVSKNIGESSMAKKY